MTFEDELRTVLHSRVTAAPDNPVRTAEVHRRITATRRRRAAAGAFALVLLALASVFALRLPGTSESLPPAVPEPPYFSGPQLPDVPGYTPVDAEIRDNGFAYSTEEAPFAHLFVVRCGQPADVTVRNTVGGDPFVVPCRTQVDDHYEGALPVSSARARVRMARQGGTAAVGLEPSAPELPDLHLLRARAPDRLSAGVGDAAYFLDGRRTPSGTTVDTVVPGRQSEVDLGPQAGFTLVVECVAGVRLTFRVPTGALGTVVCDPLDESMRAGRVTFTVPAADMRRLGLRSGERVLLTVERSGTDTDQWRVSAIG